jgi:hypothetical protein
MNFNLKPAALYVLAALFLIGLADLEASASAVFNALAPSSRNGIVTAGPQEESDDPGCDLARLMTLAGGSREKNLRSAPAIKEPPVFVKNPFL